MNILKRPGEQAPRSITADAGPRRMFPRVASRLDLLQTVEYIIIVTAYLYHLLGPRQKGVPWGIVQNSGGWGDAVLWTIVIGAFTVYPSLLRNRLIAHGWTKGDGRPERSAGESRGVRLTTGLYIAGRLILCACAVWLARIDLVPTFLFFLVLGEAIVIDHRSGVTVGVACAIILYGEAFVLYGRNDAAIYVQLLPWLAGLLFVGGTTKLLLREQEARARSDQLLIQLTEAHRQLQDYAAQVRDLATLEERNRLAREIHDSLGHYLTVISVQLQSAQTLRPRDRQRADNAVDEARRLASEALADVRRSVAALRPTALDDLSIGRAIERQVAEFRAHSGVPVELIVEGDEKNCSQAMGLALYRAVQEGLTNISKHAAASHASVILRFDPTATDLLIADNGRGIAPSLDASANGNGSGFGLTGLRERIAMLGGTVEVGPAPIGGTKLRVTVPAAGPATAVAAPVKRY